jgi:hypothetical protein
VKVNLKKALILEMAEEGRDRSTAIDLEEIGGPIIEMPEIASDLIGTQGEIITIEKIRDAIEIVQTRKRRGGNFKKTTRSCIKSRMRN